MPLNGLLATKHQQQRHHQIEQFIGQSKKLPIHVDHFNGNWSDRFISLFPGRQPNSSLAFERGQQPMTIWTREEARIEMMTIFSWWKLKKKSIEIDMIDRSEWMESINHSSIIQIHIPSNRLQVCRGKKAREEHRIHIESISLMFR